MKLTPESLDAFKRACTENEDIAEIMRTHALNWLEAPVADIGAGRGDIALRAFPTLECVLIDRLDFAQFPIATPHRRLRRDVFEATVGDLGHPRTLLMSHVLQYLDDDEDALRALLARVNAAKLLVASNINVGVLGRLIRWSTPVFPDTNPEVDVPLIDERYDCVRTWQFTTSIHAGGRTELASRALHLLDVQTTRENIDLASHFLADEGLERSLTFNQEVRAYERR